MSQQLRQPSRFLSSGGEREAHVLTLEQKDTRAQKCWHLHRLGSSFSRLTFELVSDNKDNSALLFVNVESVK